MSRVVNISLGIRIIWEKFPPNWGILSSSPVIWRLRMFLWPHSRVSRTLLDRGRSEMNLRKYQYLHCSKLWARWSSKADLASWRVKLFVGETHRKVFNIFAGNISIIKYWVNEIYKMGKSYLSLYNLKLCYRKKLQS